MKKFINWGIIGLGNAANNLAKQFVKIDNSNLLAVASLSKDKRDYYLNNYNLNSKNVYSNYDDIFYNKDIDIIYLALPNSFHEKYCLKAMKHNKNVLVEKPITSSKESFSRIKNHFLKKKTYLEEGTAIKFHPFYKKLFNCIKNIDFNEINYIKSSFGNDALGGKKIFNFRLKKINYNKRLFNKDLLGGSILDGGIYPVFLLVDIIDYFGININKINVINCKKKTKNNIDLESTLELSINNTKIELKTSLINQLENNLVINTKKKEIIFEKIFNMDSNTSIKINSKNDYSELSNSYMENSYFYEIKNISRLLLNKNINKDIFKKIFLKIENNNSLLSKWYKY
jgi:predicted dehydrogenase